MTDEYDTLEALIERLEQTPRLDLESVSEARKEFTARRSRRMLDEGLSYGEASDDQEIYSLGEEEFRAEIRRTNDDLIFQIDKFNYDLDRWFRYGEGHPPYFPMRIAIILSKRKEKDREKRFLAAYCRHFKFRAGNKDQKITERAIKKGAISSEGMPDKSEIFDIVHDLVEKHGLEARNIASNMRDKAFANEGEDIYLKYDFIWNSVCRATIDLAMVQPPRTYTVDMESLVTQINDIFPKPQKPKSIFERLLNWIQARILGRKANRIQPL